MSPTWLPLASPPSPQTRGSTAREYEHDACGVALVATMRGSAGHDIVDQALTALRNLEHRGATGADPLAATAPASSPRSPTRSCARSVDFELPPRGAYAVGIAFLPADEAERAAAVARDRGASPPRRA